jgi:hypothetical protein
VRRALLAGVVALVWLTTPALAQEQREAVVIVMDGASLPELLAVPQLRALAARGGAALMNGRQRVRQGFEEFLECDDGCVREIRGLAFRDLGAVDPSRAAEDLSAVLKEAGGRSLAMVISASPSAASAADGDELGTVIAAWGEPDELLTVDGEPRALTTDSTRRAGVVATEDPAATVAEWLGLPYDAGAPIERTAEPAPLDLYDRYLQQRRLAVPIAAGAWGIVTLAGLAGVLALTFRDRVSDHTLAAAGAIAASLPWLALALLLVGHLPSLTYATAVPFLLAVVLVGVALTRWVAARRGILAGVAACGAVILAILALEAALGWPAAVTPLVGGGQLDGGRFFGMPNIEIGLVLGCALYAAHRMSTGAGAALIAASAAVAGLPWTGSNIGAAITLFAASGLWLGIRARRAWWATALIAAATTALGVVLVGVAHRYLSARPTHASSFLEETTGVAEAAERYVDRLGIGLDLLADTPFALIPVIGTLVLLLVVLRPPSAIARSFERRDPWRDAVQVIVLGSIVAYLANDTGAAALGFGFGTALSGLVDVSLATTRGMIAR